MWEPKKKNKTQILTQTRGDARMFIPNCQDSKGVNKLVLFPFKFITPKKAKKETQFKMDAHVSFYYELVLFFHLIS